MSRAIDALVAEHAFGWTGLYRMDNVHGVAGWPGGKKAHMAPQVPPAYSTDPAASKQLRDRMRELGWNFEMRWMSGYNPWAQFWKRGSVAQIGESATEELAVALAALRALGVEVPTEEFNPLHPKETKSIP